MAFKTLQDIELFEMKPLEERDLPVSTYDIFRSGAARYGTRKALSFFLDAANYGKVTSWTYIELLEDVTRTANAFHRLGLRANGVVAYILPNLPETHMTIWGGEAAGIAFAINPQLAADQIRELLQAAGAEIVVTLAPTPRIDLWSRVRTAIATLPAIRHVVWASMAPYVSTIQRIALQAFSWRERLRLLNSSYDILDFRQCIVREPADHLVGDRTIKANNIASYFCTGGTTGLPKIAMRSHGSEVFDSWAVGISVNDPDDPPAIVLCGLPLFHVNAQLVTGLQVWLDGGTVLLATPQGYRGKDMIARLWEIVAHHRISTFSGVPTLYASLLQIEVERHDISSLRYVACGAAPMPPEVFRRFEKKTKIPIIEGYGLTEAGCVSAINLPSGIRKSGTIGFRLPYQPMAIAILGDTQDFLRWADPDEVGIIALRGPNVFEGYLGQSSQGAPWIVINDERWMNTGDLGSQDANGIFRIVGRSKELIIRGGHNIDPKLIEDTIGLHSDVAFVAAVGRPDRHAGEVPVAYVELIAGATTTVEELLRFARLNIGEPASVPKMVTVLPAMPKTAIGKIHKPTLVWYEVQNVINAELRECGVSANEIKVEQDLRHGLIIKIMLDDSADAAAVDLCLGAYTFKYIILV